LGDVVNVVTVVFWVLVLMTSSLGIESVSVALITVVDVKSAAVMRVLAVSLATTVVVVYAVITGKELVETLTTGLAEVLDKLIVLVDDIGSTDKLRVAEAVAQV
jgi:hypothetical protein